MTKTPDLLSTMHEAIKGGAAAFNLFLIGSVGGVDYKAPHALRGTPERRRAGKVQRWLWSNLLDHSIPARRPFKGHRA